MAGVFISYRRSDAQGWAGRLYDSLKVRFPKVRIFRDIDEIPSGVDFDTYINRAVRSCDVLIALIGPCWLTAFGAGKRRLEDPQDFTRREIAMALARKVRVIPVLVGNAKMPDAASLRSDLKCLARIQAHELTDSRWADDCHKLARVLKPIFLWKELKKVAAMGIAALLLAFFGANIALPGSGVGPYPPHLRPDPPRRLVREDNRQGVVERPRQPDVRLVEHGGWWIDPEQTDYYAWKFSNGQISIATRHGQSFASGSARREGPILSFGLSNGVEGQLQRSVDGELLVYFQYPSQPPDGLYPRWRDRTPPR
jgi:hypothetical protein